MAQLKDTLITGGLRVTDTTITNVLLATAIKALTSSNDSTYGLGTAGQVLVTDGTSKIYWSTLGTAATATITDRSTATAISSSGITLLTEKAIYYGLPKINYTHNYTSDTDIYAPTDSGSSAQAIIGGGSHTAPQWANISPSITIGTDTNTNAPTILISVLGLNATAQSIPIASTSTYGVTKLVDENNINSTASDLAATPSFVRSYLADGLAANDAMVFKGTLGSTNGSVSALPADGYSAGWTYRVADADTYAGEYCEVGDLIIAIKDYNSNTANPTTDWAKIEHNIDGAVYRGNANSLVTNKIVYATGASLVATAAHLLYTVTNNAAELAIGQNSTNSPQGVITLYGINAGATQIMSALNGSTNRIMYLPNYNGNGYLTHTANTDAVGSATLPVYVAENGRITAISQKINLSNKPEEVTLTNSDYGFTASLTHTYGTGKTWVSTYVAPTEEIPAPTWRKQIDLISAGSGKMGLYNRNTKTKENTDRWILYVDTNEDEYVYIPDWKSIGSSTKPIYFNASGRPVAFNYTLGANVPAAISVSTQDLNTKFLRSDGTWAIPSYTANTDTATAADDIFKGSNIGTEIKYAPYTSQQLNKLSFDTSDSFPSHTGKLNLNGYLYATKLYSGGAEVLTTNTVLKYHTSGSWNGLVYTATSVGGADPLTFTIPTGASAATVAVGNHTHTTTLTAGTGNNAVTLAYGSTYTLTAGDTSVVFTMPASDNSDTLVNLEPKDNTDNTDYKLLATAKATSNKTAEETVFVNGVTVNPSTKTITASIYLFNDSGLNNKAKILYNTTTNAIDFVFLS